MFVMGIDLFSFRIKFINMSLPSKGLRKVEFDGLTYEWTIRKKPTYMQGVAGTGMKISIQLKTDSDRSLLSVDLGFTRPDNWLQSHKTAVTPKHIVSIIDRALKAGWQSDRKKEPFKLELNFFEEFEDY
ncbi:MAG: hypothetical protein ACJA1C_001399 [Crocinitomicaceae bacterium]|jgi:hypothetical protein